jgi:hypothetical protein
VTARPVAYESVEAFYAGDGRRRPSAELDFGVWWRWRGIVYRLTWVEDTGELIAVQLSAPIVKAIPFDGKGIQYAGLAIIGGDPGGVYVLATVRGRNAIELLLDGWAEACAGDDSLAWVIERLRADQPRDLTAGLG